MSEAHGQADDDVQVVMRPVTFVGIVLAVGALIGILASKLWRGVFA